MQTWIDAAQAVVQQPHEPAVRISRQCATPYPCGFLAHCESAEPRAEHPMQWLPRVQGKALKRWIDAHPCADLKDVPDDLLNDMQRRVKTYTPSGQTFFDIAGAAAELAGHGLPTYFIDFETIQFAQQFPSGRARDLFPQVPFQFSVHYLSEDGRLDHRSFVDLSGDDPSLAFAQALVAACGDAGPVFVYNASFEATRIRELAERFGQLETALLANKARIVDLLPVTERLYYHPAQQGSWSIKGVLPHHRARAELRQSGRGAGRHDGDGRLREALAPETSPQ